MTHTITLTNAQRAEAYRIVAEILETPGYAAAVKFIARAQLRPRRVYKTMTIAAVIDAMRATTGVEVQIETMALALADTGFTSRELDGEPSTNVRLSSMPRLGTRIELSGADTAADMAMQARIHYQARMRQH